MKPYRNVSDRLLTAGFVMVLILAFASTGLNAQGCVVPSNCLPPGNSSYAGSFHAKYGTGPGALILMNPVHHMFSSCDPPPKPGPPGQSTTHEFDSEVMGHFSMAGSPPIPFAAPAKVKVTVTFAGHDKGGVTVFDTEMLQLDISGGTLPPAVKIRESPSLKSTGKTATKHVPQGMFLIQSFFDVFTELSLDDGATWIPSTDEQEQPFAGRVVANCQPKNQ